MKFNSHRNDWSSSGSRSDSNNRKLEKNLADPAALEQEAARQTAVVLSEFTQKRPDWEKYDKQMVNWGKKLIPSDSVSMLEYMEALYLLARIELVTPDSLTVKPAN